MFLTLLISSLAGFGQKKHQHKKDNLVFLLRQDEHIVQAIKTVAELYETSSSSIKPGEVVIVICGEAVKKLVKGENPSWLEESKKYPGLRVEACGLSMKKFNLQEADLLPGIMFTPNGLIRAFELQKKGYLSVEL